jgi:hypothetical protein
MSFNASTILFGLVITLVQLLAAVPWVLALFVTDEMRASLRVLSTERGGRWVIQRLGAVVLCLLAALVGLFVMAFPSDPESLETWGRVYAVVLQLQLTIDFFLLFIPVLLKVWPKGGAIALAAFRESVRQPMYWLLLLGALGLMAVSPFIPYFTFGEDHIMVKELGYDTIMLSALAFGTLAASLFVSEEIEGRTAVTLMSKPVSRRQFLLGKFAGIMLAALLMFGLLGVFFEGSLVFKRWLDRLDITDPVPPPVWVNDWLAKVTLAREPKEFLRGVGYWADLTLDTLPGLVLAYCQVMVLVSIAVSLATRLPMVVNLSIVLVIYFLSHLTPVLLSIGQKAQKDSPGSTVARLLTFAAQLFDTLLPGLDFFKVGPSLISDAPPPTGPFWLYILSVAGYGCLYTFIVLLFGLILFEDRDLA